jgi:hypothetical protein
VEEKSSEIFKLPNGWGKVGTNFINNSRQVIEYNPSIVS